MKTLQAGHALAGAAGVVVLLHGRGASADDILGLAAEWDFDDVAYLAPQAPGNAWYPKSFLSPLGQNEPWLSASLQTVKQTVDEIVQAGVAQERIVIGGFSQGACLASEFVARHAARYGGLIAFTGGLIGPPGTEFRYEGNLQGTPVFLGAGDHDPHVPWERVRESGVALTELGAEVVVKQYPGLPHTVNRDEIAAAGRLIGTMVGRQAAPAPRGPTS